MSVPTVIRWCGTIGTRPRTDGRHFWIGPVSWESTICWHVSLGDARSLRLLEMVNGMGLAVQDFRCGCVFGISTHMIFLCVITLYVRYTPCSDGPGRDSVQSVPETGVERQ